MYRCFAKRHKKNRKYTNGFVDVALGTRPFKKALKETKRVVREGEGIDMPVNTRALEYVESPNELRTARRVDRANVQAYLLTAEQNNSNIGCGVEYDHKSLQAMLLSHTDVYGHITPSDKANVRQLFRDRQAWKLATRFRSIWCNIGMLRVTLMVARGWQLDAVTQHIAQPYLGLSIYALLFQGSPDPPVLVASIERAIAEMDWRTDICETLFQLSTGPVFQANLASLTADNQVAYGLIPKHLDHSQVLVDCVRRAIGICATVRMYRDNFSPGAAFEAVVNSGGLRAEFFGEP